MEKCFLVHFFVATLICLSIGRSEKANANPIPNPSFEQVDEEGWAIGWIRSPGDPANIVEISPRHRKDGINSLHMKFNYRGEKAVNCDVSSTPFPIKASSTYQLSFYCHGIGNVFTFFYDRNGRELEQDRKYYGFSGRKFEKNTITFTPPPEAQKMSIMFRVYPPEGSAWIDSIELEEVKAEKWIAEIPNPSFELSRPNGAPMGWHFEPNSTSNTAELSSQYALFGRKSLHLKCVQPPYCDAFSEDFPITGGVTYTLSFYAIAPQRSGVFVFVFNGKGEEIGALEADAGRHFFFQTEENSFQRVEIKFTPKVGAEYMHLYFRAYPGGEIWIDGVQIESGEASEFAHSKKSYTSLLLNWRAYKRGDFIPISAHLYNSSEIPLSGVAYLSVFKGSKLVDISSMGCSVEAKETKELKFFLNSSYLGCGDYRLVFSFANLPESEEEILIVPARDKGTIAFGFYGYSLTGLKYSRPGKENLLKSLDLLASAKMNIFSGYIGDLPGVLDQMAKMGISFGGVGNPPVSAPDDAKPEDYTLTSEGKVQMCFWAPSTNKPRLSYISPLARDLARRGLGIEYLHIREHPAFSGNIFFGDDFFMWRGTSWEDFRCGPLADYSYHAVRTFRDRTGLEAPKPTKEELAHIKGIIPDDDPWLLWNRFRCQDVFAGYMEVVCKTYEEKLGAKVHHVFETWWDPGHGVVPYFLQKILTLPGYYSYPPSPYQHIFGVEVVRLGAWEKDIYIIPSGHNNSWGKWFIEETTPEYERASFNSILAGGAKGVLYCPFQPEWEWDEGHPAVWEEFRRQGELLEKFGKFLYSLRRQREPVGLLISFSTDVYRILEQPEPGHIYPFKEGHLYRVAGTFFAMLRAQIPVELVDEDKISSGDLSHYKVIYLADVSVLPSSVAKALEKFISSGGIVLLDNLCKVEIKGARKLPFNACIIPIDKRDRESNVSSPEPFNKYELQKAVELLKNAFSNLVTPVLKTDSLEIACRRFTSTDGQEYLFLINLDQDNPTKARVEFYNHNEAVDVLSGKTLKSGDTLQLPPGGSALLSFAPRVTDIKIDLPEKVVCGEHLTLSINFFAGKKQAEGAIPIKLTVLNSRGEIEEEWSKCYVANSGNLFLSILLPFGAETGKWHFIVEDLVSHRVATACSLVLPSVEFSVSKMEVDKPYTQRFWIKIANNSQRKKNTKLLAVCDEALSLSFSDDLGELLPGEERNLYVDISSKPDDEFSLGPQRVTFVLKIEGYGALSTEQFFSLE